MKNQNIQTNICENGLGNPWFQLGLGRYCRNEEYPFKGIDTIFCIITTVTEPSRNEEYPFKGIDTSNSSSSQAPFLL